jgi:hypothetical protein
VDLEEEIGSLRALFIRERGNKREVGDFPLR